MVMMERKTFLEAVGFAGGVWRFLGDALTVPSCGLIQRILDGVGRQVVMAYGILIVFDHHIRSLCTEQSLLATNCLVIDLIFVVVVTHNMCGPTRMIYSNGGLQRV